MNIITKPLADLTDEEYRACWYLNHRNLGYMMEDVQKFRKRSDCLTIMLWEGKLLGWALLVPTREPELQLGRYPRRVSKYSLQTYVRASERGKGLGTVLMDEVVMLYDSRPYVHPWNNTSGEFYSNYTVSCSKRARKYINQGKKRKRSRGLI